MAPLKEQISLLIKNMNFLAAPLQYPVSSLPLFLEILQKK